MDSSQTARCLRYRPRHFRLYGALARLSIGADDLHRAAKSKRMLESPSYKAEQARLYENALKLVSSKDRHKDTD